MVPHFSFLFTQNNYYTATHTDNCFSIGGTRVTCRSTAATLHKFNIRVQYRNLMDASQRRF